MGKFPRFARFASRMGFHDPVVLKKTTNVCWIGYTKFDPLVVLDVLGGWKKSKNRKFAFQVSPDKGVMVDAKRKVLALVNGRDRVRNMLNQFK